MNTAKWMLAAAVSATAIWAVAAGAASTGGEWQDNQALSFGDKFFFMKNGVIKYAGEKEIITKEVIKDIFDIDVKIIQVDGQTVIIGGNRYAN